MSRRSPEHRPVRSNRTWIIAAGLLLAAATSDFADLTSLPAPFSILPQAALAAPGDPVYRDRDTYPIFEEMRAARDSIQAFQDSLRKVVDERYREEAEKERRTGRRLRLDWSGIDRPESPESFQSAFHLPPVAQYNTGTCWGFCSTSFFESEAARLTGREIKLSEMWTVYWEYVEKARRFVREYGHSSFSPGSQDQSTREVYRIYGTVPLDAYSGNLASGERHDHTFMHRELRDFLDWVEEENYWNEESVILYVRSVLDRYLGPPPETLLYEGQEYKPRQFLAAVLGLDMNDYESIVSTMAEPFGERILLDYPDNWRRKDDYLNLPLEDFYDVIRSSLQDGYTLSIGGDVSEPGMDGLYDAAIIPEWDIPSEYINQASREFRIYNETTGDDHGVHLVGFLHQGGSDWFLAKDSNSSSRMGQFPGYYFYSGDYIRLKMLSVMVHKDRLAGFLKQEGGPGM